MKVEVSTYDDPRRWKHHSQFHKIKNAIHICATKNMADGIMKAYQNLEVKEFVYIFTIREIIDELLNKWNLPEEQLKQYLILSRVINDYNTEKEDLKNAFKNNKSDILETIRFLTYAGMEPLDLATLNSYEKLTDKEKVFQQIWLMTEEKDSTYKNMRYKIGKGWTKNEVKSKLNQLQIEKQKPELNFDINKIVLHGFYFITAEQQVFLQTFLKAGFEIVFFNFYDQRFPETFDFTRAFISEKFQWTDNWKFESNRLEIKESLGSKFLSAFEGKNASNFSLEQDIIRYDSFFEFLNEVIVKHYPIGEPELEREDNHIQIIATNADMLNDILVQYYPDKFADKRNFLHYPIGQFISKIHHMFEGGKLILNEDILISTFSSGWLHNPITNENARDYTYLLKKVLPFFGDCRAAEEDWLPRFKELNGHYDNILRAFEQPGDNRIVSIVRNPFAKIAHFSLTRNQVEGVEYFVKQLIFIAEELFEIGAREASISNHFKRILEIVNKHNPTSHSILLQNEADIISQLNQKLKRIQDDNFFLYDDVGEAINVYLSGKLSKEDSTFIKPFIEVDGEAFKKGATYYLTGLDEKGLPLDEFSTPWPLQEDTFEKLSIRHEVLEMNALRNKSVKQISRYLLFIALEFLMDKNMELSWMRNFLDRNDLQPTIYAHQLGLNIKDYKEYESDILENTRPNPIDFRNIVVEQIEKELADLSFTDFLLEYNQCKRRFYFSYVLNSSPAFTDEYIHQFLYSELIRLVRRNTNLRNSEVIKVVSDLFPQWTDYKKQTIGETYVQNRSRGEKLEAVAENVLVSESRRNFQLPGLFSKERNQLIEQTIKKKPNLLNEIKNDTTTEMILPASPGKHCKYCPHIDSCGMGQFPLDEVNK